MANNFTTSTATVKAKKKADSYNATTPEQKMSNTTKGYQTTMNNTIASKPKEWNADKEMKGLNQAKNNYINRQPFSYDFSTDALYQQYKDKYMQQGKLAMADTVAQASALTGGYGNSYATSAGFQAYQNSLDNLNDIIPQLYQMAMDKYNMEGEQLYNAYNMESNQYGLRKDAYDTSVNNWQYDMGMASDNYWQSYGMDVNNYNSDRDYYTSLYNTLWGQDMSNYQQGVSEDQWNKEYALKQASLAAQQQANATALKNQARSQIETTVKAFSNNDDLYNYLAKNVDEGIITEKEAEELYSQYAIQKNLNNSKGKYSFGTGATGGYNVYTQSLYKGK